MDAEQWESNELRRTARLHKQVFTVLLEKVEQDRYPSTQQLDLLERYLVGEERERFVDVLVEKVQQDRYPSMSLVRRVIRLTA